MPQCLSLMCYPLLDLVVYSNEKILSICVCKASVRLQNMHLILITSSIESKNSPSVFSTEERFQQLLLTIQNVRSNLPSHYIVIVEGSPYTEDQKDAVIKSGAQQIFHCNVNMFDKQYGEAWLLRSFLRSEMFKGLIQIHSLSSITKLSGRYLLTKGFVFHYDGDTCVCKISPPDKSYSGYGFLYTRYFSFPIQYLDNFLHGLDKCCQSIFINIEHSFYLYQTLPIDKINHDIQKINVGGFIASNGEYVED